MSKIGTRGPDVFARNPEHARLVCDMLSDDAAKSRKYTKRRAYNVLRQLSPDELYAMLEAARDSRERFVQEFGPLYHREVGETSVGELFDGHGMLDGVHNANAIDSEEIT